MGGTVSTGGPGRFGAWVRAGAELCAATAILGAWFVGQFLVDVFGPE